MVGRVSPPQRESAGERGDPRARIVGAARELFRRRGINATGIAELCGRAGVSKRTLYQHFASKDDVVVAYLDSFTGDRGYAPEAVLARTDLTPRARLLELFAALAHDNRPLRGDPWLDAAVELSDPARAPHRLAAEHKRRFAERLGELARAAGARDPERLGCRLALLYDGAAAQIVVQDDPSPAAEAHALAAMLLHQALD
jgi:AcrR family transcriptional regulator